MKQTIFKTPNSPSYKNYEREVYMSEYVTIPKARLRRLIITEVIAWGVALFMTIITFIR